MGFTTFQKLKDCLAAVIQSLAEHFSVRLALFALVNFKIPLSFGEMLQETQCPKYLSSITLRFQNIIPIEPAITAFSVISSTLSPGIPTLFEHGSAL